MKVAVELPLGSWSLVGAALATLAEFVPSKASELLSLDRRILSQIQGALINLEITVPNHTDGSE